MAKKPSTTSQTSVAVKMASLAKAAVKAAAEYGIKLDFSSNGAKDVERVIAFVETDTRIFLDLKMDARVADDVAGVLDLEALGAYYGELFVRHASAKWGKAEGEGGPEPAVMCGGVTFLPLDTVRRRVYDGRQVDLDAIFKRQKAAMARSQKAKGGKKGTRTEKTN